MAPTCFFAVSQYEQVLVDWLNRVGLEKPRRQNRVERAGIDRGLDVSEVNLHRV